MIRNYPFISCNSDCISSFTPEGDSEASCLFPQPRAIVALTQLLHYTTMRKKVRIEIALERLGRLNF